MLYRATRFANESQSDQWEYAVEIEGLRESGLTTNDLRWLVCHGYILHAVEITTPASRAREFQPVANLSFGERTCFVLTAQGQAWLDGSQAGKEALLTVDGSESITTESDPPSVPHWDAAARELHWGYLLVKCFRQPAPNQERILNAFKEEGWPTHLDDPLSGEAGQDAKQRLHQTIRSLNQHQMHQLIRFRGDGTGEGICWQTIEQPSNDR